MSDSRDKLNGEPWRYPNSIPTISESYSVLPVGNGNFLKVYHSNESDPPPFNNYELFSSNSFIPHHTAVRATQHPNNVEVQQSPQMNDNATNMIINQLVTNWTPNMSGTYSPFGEQPPVSAPPNAFPTSPEEIPNHDVPVVLCSNNDAESVNNLKNPAINIVTPPPKTNGSFASGSPPVLPEVKKRIVAEVKPMRMSYSDVLSKNVSVNKKVSSNGQNSTSNSSDPGNPTKNQKFVFEKSKSAFNLNEKKSQNAAAEEKDRQELKTKKSEQSNSSRGEESYTFVVSSQRDKAKVGSDDNSKDNSSNQNGKSTKKPNLQATKKKTKNQPPANDSKRRSMKRDSEERIFFGNSNSTNSSKDNEKEFYSFVTKNETSFESKQKPSQHSSSGSKKSKPTSTGITGNQKNSYRLEKQSFYSKRQKPRKNAHYEMLYKFGEKWLEYTLKIINWLFYLIYDVIVLGFGMVYDRLSYGYDCSLSIFMNLRQEFKNNSGKPNAWLKNLFKQFDGKFAVGSTWAFWRKFYKKKPLEPDTEFYKNGRLPQTGDEAMYSLLNCKGKDAYSILGVTADSSQEQIRKHYKKIAVLVHPDKNKQPGAEEAFKVLQRAFELIGEPENRNAYDQSLAEALNAEKAWSELHDLLSQLQSKIAEAANTIRCSSCGLRHPRKLTERPHYAARECSSCKIRHSAREGDIWAETSLFGLRWKYLALMEGKVYDITEWANCQKGALSHLQPNSHTVQYRIVRGGQQQQQQQQQQQTQQYEKERTKREPPNEPSLDEFLDNLYSGQNPQAQNTSRRRTKRN